MPADGQQFITALRRIGYPNVKKLDGHDFDWMFDIPEIRPFLTWFCESVHERNVLTDSELQEYEELKSSSPDAILEDERLEKCLNCLPADCEDVSLENLKQEVSILSKHLKSREIYLNQLRQRRDILQIHQIKLNNQSEKLEDLISSIKYSMEHQQHKFLGLQKKLTNCLQSVTLHVQEVTNLFKNMSENKFENGEMSCASFANVDLKVYLKTEDQLLQQLRSYIKQHLNRPLIDLTCNTTCDVKYELLDLTTLSIPGNAQRSNKDIEKNCKEISRLHKILQVTEESRVKNLLAKSKAQGKVKFLENKLHKNYVATLPTHQKTLSLQQKELEQQLIRKQTEFEELCASTLPKAIQKCIQCRSAVVLTGDYEAKLARQEYFLGKQHMVTNQLLKQRARWELLLLTFQAEAHQQKDIYKILMQLHSNFDSTWISFTSRKNWMNDLQIKSISNNKELHAEDRTAHNLMKLLETETKQSGRVLFVTYRDLQELAEKVVEEQLVLQSFISSSYADQMQKLAALKDCFNQWYGIVYGDQDFGNGDKSLMGPLDVKMLSKLQMKIHVLEKHVKDIVRDIEKKKKHLKENNYKTEERKLFVYFYTAPEKLQAVVNDLLKQVEGEKALLKSH